jgi:lipopolysaccharide transport system ATP-binding protein
VTETLDIREPARLELEFEVLQGGRLLVYGFSLYNDQDVCVLDLVDLDPAWRGRPRPPGRYRTTMWIPGDFLADGTYYVDVGLSAMEPEELQLHERQVISFNVVELEPGAARGEWTGEFDGVLRPVLSWKTEHLAPPPRLGAGLPCEAEPAPAERAAG